MTMTNTIEPVHKMATVPCDAREAFDLFTARLHQWWPLATHSLALGDAAGVAITPAGVGGEIVETASDGRTFVWGTITEWVPGARVAFTWHPGSDPDEATLVEVTFAPAGTGGCVVELVHSGWERRADGDAVRAHYVPGWDVVLGPYFAQAGGGRP